MFKQKNALIALAVATFLTACGGGGDSNTAGTKQPTTTTPTTTTPGNQNQNPTPTNTTVADKKLEGHLTLMNQVLVNDKLFDLVDFEGNDAANKRFGVYGQAEGTNAPIQSFGLRVMQVEIPTTGTSGNGHVAIEIIDSATGAPQQLQMAIDQVNYAINASGDWAITIPTTAKLYIHVRNSAGGVADQVVTGLPADLVKPTPITGDPSSQGLTVDVDKAFATAKTKATAAQKTVLDSVSEFKGTFNLNATFSGLDVRLPGQATPLQGAAITVAGANQPAVTGSGVKGKLWVKDLPPGI